MTPVLALALGVDKRRGEEAPVRVLWMSWTDGDLPHRSEFFALIADAYEEIELPFFPSRAFVTVETPRRRETIDCREPVDEPFKIGLALWDGVIAATLDYG